MSIKKKLLLSSAALIVVGVLIAFFVNTKGTEPSFECAPADGPTSGFTDSSQNNCPVSIDSYNAWREWRKQPYYGRIAGLGVVTVGLVVGVVGLVKKSKKPTI